MNFSPTTMRTFKGAVFAMMMASALIADAQSAEGLRHKAAHLLQSGSMRVEVMDPADPDRYNRGVRFSPIANVLRVVVDGRDFLFSPVEHNPMLENAGLAMEFDISDQIPPPAFNGAATGAGFLKVGVGVLRKSGETYRFIKDYEVIDLAKTEATWGEDFARFEQICPGIDGYAYKLNAEVRVMANVLEIKYNLANTGSRSLSTEQYTHNFLLLGNGPIGAGYEVEFPDQIRVLKGLTTEQIVTDRAIEICSSISKATNLFIETSSSQKGANTLTVRNKLNGMTVRTSVSQPVARVAIHAAPPYICPEQFVRIDLEPGQSMEWTRRFEFQIASNETKKSF